MRSIAILNSRKPVLNFSRQLALSHIYCEKTVKFLAFLK